MAKRLVLVDDNAEVRRMYERAFRMRGIDVEPIADGALALQKLQGEETLPDAVLLDINLPSVGGREILYRMKTDERLKHVPVVVLTNSVSEHDEDDYLSLGAALFLIKIEFSPKEVVDKIEHLINAGSEAKS